MFCNQKTFTFAFNYNYNLLNKKKKKMQNFNNFNNNNNIKFYNFIICFNFLSLFNCLPQLNQNKFIISTIIFSTSTFYLFYKLYNFTIDYNKIDYNLLDYSKLDFTKLNFTKYLQSQLKIDLKEKIEAKIEWYQMFKLIAKNIENIDTNQVWSDLVWYSFNFEKLTVDKNYKKIYFGLSEDDQFIAQKQYIDLKKSQLFESFQISNDGLIELNQLANSKLIQLTNFHNTFDFSINNTGILFKNIDQVSQLLQNLYS